MSRNGLEALSDVREWSGGPPECSGVVGSTYGCTGLFGRPSQMSGRGREALPDVREWLGRPPGCTGVVLRPSRMSGSGREALPDVQKALSYAW